MRETIVDLAAAKTTATTSGILSGVGVIYAPNTYGAILLVSIVTLASRLLVLLINSQDAEITPRRVAIAFARALLSAVCVAIVTLTLGVAGGLPLPIISALGTVFGANPKLLEAILGSIGRVAKKWTTS